MKKPIGIAFCLGLCLFAFGQNDEIQKIRASHQNRHHELLSEYTQFCALPNTWNDPEQLRQNAAFIVEMMKKRGITNARTIEAKVAGANSGYQGALCHRNNQGPCKERLCASC